MPEHMHELSEVMQTEVAVTNEIQPLSHCSWKAPLSN